MRQGGQAGSAEDKAAAGKEGGQAGSAEDKAAAGKEGGQAGSAEDKAAAGRAGSAEDKAAAGRAGSAEDKAAAGRAGSAEDKAAAGERSGERRKAEMALVIKKKWLDKIFARKKVWEIRSSSTKRRGWIHLAESGSGNLCGGAKLKDCIPVPRGEFLKHRRLHGVTSLNDVKYKKIWAWVLSDARKYSCPFDYDHTQGAVIFVRVRGRMGPQA
jgi:hypothetical protein